MSNVQRLAPTIGGPILFGYCLDIFLFGILTVQTYLYYLAFPKDRRMTKIIVYFVYVIGALQTALDLHDFYSLFCTPEGNRYLEPSTGFDVHRFGFMWFTIPVGGTLVACVVQLFYAHRIHVISGVKVITATVSVLAFTQLVCGIVTAVLIFGPPHLGGNVAPGRMGLLIAGLIGTVCDLLIAVYMSSYLSRQMRGTPETTQVLVTKVVRLLLETGALTAGMAMACALLFVLSFGSGWFMIPGLSVGKLYANSMLVLLNNRFTILGGRNASHPDFDIPSYRCSDPPEINVGTLLSHNIAFAQNRRAETAFSGGDVHAIELNSRLGRVSQESKRTGDEAKTEVVRRSVPVD